MNILKRFLLAFAINVITYEAIIFGQSNQMVSEPIKLQQLKTQEKSLIQEISQLSDSNLHRSKLNLIIKTSHAKIDKQAKIDQLPPTTSVAFATPEHWKRQIAITITTIQDLQKLLDREQEGRHSSAKIHKDLKREFFLANQDPESRNQDLES